MNIKDVANKANVSVATISRAMNIETRFKVTKKTLKKIDQVIDQCGYRPNLAAKNLRQTKTHVIGVIFPYFQGVFYHTYYMHVLSGVADYLAETDYQFKLLLLKDGESRSIQYDFKSGEKVDGIIVTHWTNSFPNKQLLNKINVPCVFINDYDADVNNCIVYADHYRGGYLAAEYLYKKGHRKIGVLCGPDWSKDNKERLQGFKDYLLEKNVVVGDKLIIQADYLEEMAYHKFSDILVKAPEITALFCTNDQMAFGVLRKLKELDMSCPEDISIIGFDNDFCSVEQNPSLTTIDVPVYKLAYEAAQVLVEHLNVKKIKVSIIKRNIKLSINLIERQSVRDISKNKF